MYSNQEICIIAYKAITERIALLYSGILIFCAQSLCIGAMAIRLATWLAGTEHYSTCKLVWESMYSNRKICMIAHRAIIEGIALLCNRILQFRLGKVRVLSCRANNMSFTMFASISCIFCGLNSSIAMLICMYNNVSMPTSYVAGRNCHFAPTP